MKSISICIPTKGRIECLTTLFASLKEECDRYPGKTEVIIADNSHKDEAASIEQMCSAKGFKFYPIDESISYKRNKLSALAQHEIVLFLDSDCEPQPGILEAHSSSYTNPDTGAALGIVEFVGPKPFFWKIIEEAGYTRCFTFASYMPYAWWGPCANISFTKNALESIGGFKEQFPFNYSGEDVDVGIRINKAGYKIACQPHAIAFHNTRTWLNVMTFSKKIYRWGRTDFYLMKDHMDMTYPEFLRFPFIVSLMLILVLTGICTILSFASLLIFTPFFIWICSKLLFHKAWKRGLFTGFFSFYLNQIFDTGFIVECFLKGRPLLAFKKMVYGINQLQYELEDKSCVGIAMLISFIASLLIGRLIQI